MHPRIWTGIACVSLVILVPALQLWALTPDEVFVRVKDSVFVVKSFDSQSNQIALGSAVLLPGGRVATNCHVVEGGVRFRVGRGKVFAAATLYAENRDADICILDVPGITGQPAQLGKASSLKIGEAVYAVGAPRGLELSLSDGIVSQLRGGAPPLVQTTAAISPGSSGGGLFDSEARLVGFTTLIVEGGQSLNFAMPVEWLAGVRTGTDPAEGRRSSTEWHLRCLAIEKGKDWLGLMDLAERWTRAQGKNAYSWYFLGLAFAGLERNIEAVEALRASAQLNAKNASTWIHLGIAYANLNRLTDAIEANQQAVRIDSDERIAWNNLGVVYERAGRYGEAAEAYRQGLRIDPRDAETWYSVGVACAGLDRHAEAIEAYRRALQLEPGNARAWNNIGVVYSVVKRYSEAIEAYRKAVKLDEGDLAAWRNLGNVCVDAGRWEDAIEAFRTALVSDPNNADSWFQLGYVYANMDRNSEAMKAYRQALRIDPKNKHAWFNLGLGADKAGDASGALEAVRALREIDASAAEELLDAIVPR